MEICLRVLLEPPRLQQPSNCLRLRHHWHSQLLSGCSPCSRFNYECKVAASLALLGNLSAFSDFASLPSKVHESDNCSRLVQIYQRSPHKHTL